MKITLNVDKVFVVRYSSADKVINDSYNFCIKFNKTTNEQGFESIVKQFHGKEKTKEYFRYLYSLNKERKNSTYVIKRWAYLAKKEDRKKIKELWSDSPMALLYLGSKNIILKEMANIKKSMVGIDKKIEVRCYYKNNSAKINKFSQKLRNKIIPNVI